MKKKFCFITGSRSDFGIMSDLILKLSKSKKIKFELLVIGSHFSRTFGNTIKEVNVPERFQSKIFLNLDNSKVENIIKFSNNLLSKLNSFLDKIIPDIIILLGDRYEALVCSYVATLKKIPIIHFCGGDITLGSYDNQFRNAITKMANFHFVTNELSKKRVIKMGEKKKNVFNYGHLSLDFDQKDLFTKRDLEEKFNIVFFKKNILVSFHSETLSKNNNLINFKILLECLSKFKNVGIFFSSPNADIDGNKILKLIKYFVKKNRKNSFYIPSFGHKYYLSILKYVDCIVGNSSSGILEAPSLSTPSLNLGDRQKGRLMAKSVFNSKFSKKDINKKINYLINKFKKKRVINPFFKKNSIKNTFNQLIRIKFPVNINKY